jgi:hypothetical protein
MKSAYLIRAAVLSAGLLAIAASAQEYRARVQGIVSDASDAVVAGAVVRLRNVATDVQVVRQTDSYGRYLFDLVEPGAYTLTGEMAGFARYLQENIPISRSISSCS